MKFMDNEQKEPISSFIQNQTQKKYFLPIATTTFFTLGIFMPVMMNRSKFTELTEIKKFLGSIPKKDFALTGLKSLFVASHLTTEFKSNEKGKRISDCAQRLSLLGLLTVYTHKTVRDLLKAEEPRKLETLFEKLLENYGTIGMVNTLIKGMKNNDTSLIERSKINRVKEKNQEYAYYGSLIALLCLWEHGIKKDFSRDAILKTTTNILSLAALTSYISAPYNDALKKLFILVLLGYAIKKFYTNSESSLEQSEIKLIALEDITRQIGKDLALPTIFNTFIDFFNSHIFPKSKEEEERTNKEFEGRGRKDYYLQEMTEEKNAKGTEHRNNFNAYPAPIRAEIGTSQWGGSRWFQGGYKN